MFGLGLITPIISMLWHRLQELRDDDRGMTTETMIITALLAAAALAAVGLIVAAIRSKSTQIQSDINGA
ncbi:MAG TPA: hypothetical protein VF743_07175 [Acidimicrobiales bacterium]